MKEAIDDQHSGRTRVTPVFEWLREKGGPRWTTELLRLAEGIELAEDVGDVIRLWVGEEKKVPPSPQRLAWLIRNAPRLAPLEGRAWRQYQRRIIENPARDETLRKLDGGVEKGIPKRLILEGPTRADCLIECEKALVWIEGKRNDWLSPSTTWDITRDQLARNLEALWLLASESQKNFWLLICHEHDLKHHEQELVTGYRLGTWGAGFPHLSAEVRAMFQTKIGTLRWRKIFEHWPQLAARVHA